MNLKRREWNFIYIFLSNSESSKLLPALIVNKYGEDRKIPKGKIAATTRVYLWNGGRLNS